MDQPHNPSHPHSGAWRCGVSTTQPISSLQRSHSRHNMPFEGANERDLHPIRSLFYPVDLKDTSPMMPFKGRLVVIAEEVQSRSSISFLLGKPI